MIVMLERDSFFNVLNIFLNIVFVILFTHPAEYLNINLKMSNYLSVFNENIANALPVR